MLRILTIAHTVWLGIIRRKDIYVLLILLGALLLLLVSLNVFGLCGTVRYVQDLGLLASWFFSWILAVNLSSRELPAEETSGTIFPLLAKPLTRAELLAGKWLGTWTAATIATIGFYILVAGIVSMKGGVFDLVALIQAIALHSMAIGIMCVIGLAFSTRMNHDAAASVSFVLTGAAFLVIPRIPEFMSHESGFTSYVLLFLYNAMPHFEVFDMRKRLVHDFGPADWNTFLIVMVYGILLCVLYGLLAWIAYRNKRFSRENQV